MEYEGKMSAIQSGCVSTGTTTKRERQTHQYNTVIKVSARVLGEGEGRRPSQLPVSDKPVWHYRIQQNPAPGYDSTCANSHLIAALKGNEDFSALTHVITTKEVESELAGRKTVSDS
jgi:hypothetical protein